ncbi:MAG TPA: hypothetical protein VGE79_01870, partial [Niastella sp.]
RLAMAKIGLSAGPGMVAMGMGDHRFFNQLPGVYIEVTLLSKETFVCEGYQCHEMAVSGYKLQVSGYL